MCIIKIINILNTFQHRGEAYEAAHHRYMKMEKRLQDLEKQKQFLITESEVCQDKLLFQTGLKKECMQHISRLRSEVNKLYVR